MGGGGGGGGLCPQYILGWRAGRQQLASYLSKSSICNPVDSKSYWSIDKLVGLGLPNIFLSSYTLLVIVPMYRPIQVNFMKPVLSMQS